ncbi:ras-related protein Rab-37 isoform X4 [Scleropages formosus]|uniref:ras-related protein Rab-37 isoform X4 n=1 Tax=Scleropages formosus TaxID=113540 RepID=UPI000877F4EE|nr:ras-related protein Rab-37-like isoform X4 [Scleropages formosus]
MRTTGMPRVTVRPPAPSGRTTHLTPEPVSGAPRHRSGLNRSVKRGSVTRPRLLPGRPLQKATPLVRSAVFVVFERRRELICVSALALLLLYDITSKSSFDNIRAWLTEIHEYAQKDVVIMLLGNKSDMVHERVIKQEEGQKLAREYGVPFMETSAKTGVNVELAFLAVAKELKQRVSQQPNEPKFQIHEYIESQKQKSGCCGFM